MSTQKSPSAFGPGRILQKSFVSGFVLVSYLAYAVHEHFATPSQAVTALPSSSQPGQVAQLPLQDQAAQVLPRKNLAAPAPTAAPSVTGGQYKDGTFTGASANAFYGQVQVQVVTKDGKISSVTFLDYPKDRRTSARINSVAVPTLQSEAIQAQSAQVDVVSGATLTSEAFMASLQSALDSAHS